MTFNIKNNQFSNRGMYVFFWFFVLALLIRFPYFFRDYIDKDESTFILMGQAWVDGHLPYTFLWDLKPPITFGFFAVIISIFGKSFFWIRMAGVLLVSATAYMVYKLVYSETKNLKIARFSALLSLLFSSLFGSVQGVMSEHISMLFFVGGLYLMCLKKQQLLTAIFGGFLLGLAAMTKLNLAYAILLVALFISYVELTTNPFKKGVKRPVFLVFGVLAGILSTAVPYLKQEALAVWWRSVFLASGSYAQINIQNSLILAPIILILCVYTYKNKTPSNRIVSISLIGVLVSFVLAGKINGHYLLQVYPLLFILIGFSLRNSKVLVSKLWWMLLLVVPVESYLEYVNITKHYKEYGSFYNGEGIEIPAYLKRNQLDKNRVLFFEYHIGYWLLDKTPPSMAVTHPSNLFRPALFPHFNPRQKSQEELEYLLDSLKPAVIVINKSHSLFVTHPNEKQYFELHLKQFYAKDTLIGKGVVYTRR